MKPRRRLNLTDKVEILAIQAICPKCDKPLGQVKGIDWHHPNELEISGDDSNANRVAMHHDCHAIVTNGTKATSAGSSKHKVAKVRRLVSAQGTHLLKMANKMRQEEREETKYRRRFPSQRFRRHSKSLET